MNVKKILALVMAMIMVFSLVGCGTTKEETKTEETKTEETKNEETKTETAPKDSDLLDERGQIGLGASGEVEVNKTDIHMDAVEASTSGNWEAMFTPLEVEGRAIDMADVDISPTPEEQAAMEAEPAYGQPIIRYMTDGCSSGINLAEYLGYYEEAGLTTEVVKGSSYVEALGTGQAHVCVGHIASQLVPITNGVNVTFVGGAHLGCKSLYVLADSEYQTTEDLIGTAISVPNGVGNSDYNITAMLLDDDGIDPQTDVTLTQVTADACIAAMQNGEISAALLSDVYAYGMVKDGTLRCVSSMFDSDYTEISICCVIAVNTTFLEENPTICKKLVQAIQKAHAWMRENPEEATEIMLAEGWNNGDLEMNVMINEALQFGLSDEFTEANLREIAQRYIDLGIITSTDNVDEIMEMAWKPVLD